MAFCTKCGAQIDDNASFCPSCGANQQNGGFGQPQTSGKSDNDKLMGVLAYFGLLVLIPIFAEKDSVFARYHSNQGLILFIANVIASIVSGVLSLIPFVGIAISILLSLACIVLMIIGIVNAAKGEMKPLPVIGSFQLLK